MRGRSIAALASALALHGLLVLFGRRQGSESSLATPVVTAWPRSAPSSQDVVELDTSFDELTANAESSQATPTAQTAGHPVGGEAEGLTREPGAFVGRTGAERASQSRIARSAPSPDGEVSTLRGDHGAVTDHVGAAAGEAGAGEAGAGDPTLASAAAATPTGTEAAAVHRIDLGIGGHVYLLPQEEVGPRASPNSVQRQLQSALSEADVRRGLSRGNPLLDPIRAAIRAEGPLRGEALLRVTVGRDGALSDVELLEGSLAEWSKVTRLLRELASRTKLHLPEGAAGLRVTFSIRSKSQRSSGKEDADLPVGVAEPSLRANGFTLHGDFDVADFAGGHSRMVTARVVSEEVL